MMTSPLLYDRAEAAGRPLPPNDLLARLSPAVSDRLGRLMDVVPLRAGAVLCESGTVLRHVWFLRDAVAATVVPLPEGDVVDVGLLGPEALIGTDLLFGQRRSANTVVVQIGGHASRMNADDFRREVVLRRDEPYGTFMRFAAAYQRLVAQLAACSAHHDLVHRLARLLLMLDDRLAHAPVDITQERLAGLLAARRASITKAAMALRSCGALEYRRGRITIRDRRALLGASCACYPVLARLVPRVDVAGTMPLALAVRTG